MTLLLAENTPIGVFGASPEVLGWQEAKK